MDDEFDKPFPESRPSGVLDSGRGFRIGKFLAITAGLAAAGGVGAMVHKVLTTPEPEPPPPPQQVQDAKPPEPEPEPEPEPKPTKLDLGDSPRLDIPDPSFDDPRQAPAPGPEVETPNW